MHILLIEDDPNDAFLLKELLESYQKPSIKITEADSINSAEKALFSKQFDAILLDLSLADCKGIQSFYSINAHSSSTPIIILTGNSDQKIAIEAVKAGAQDYLHKDELTAKTLLRVINYAIERKQIEEKLKEVSERLHLALSAARVGTWSIDLVTQKAYWDDYLHRLYGVEPGTFSGEIEDALSHIHPDDRERARTEVFNAIRENALYDTEHRTLCPDGTIRILAKRGEVQRDPSGKAIRLTGVCWDVTERKKAEQWFHKHRFELANVSRINSMGEVATTLSHELNQPLAAVNSFIQGCIHHINSDSANKEDIINALTQASQQVERAGKIIETIERFAHKGTLIYELSNINSIIQEAYSLACFEHQEFKPIVKFNLDNHLPQIKIDRIQIQQVLINLITNSIEALQISNINKPLITIATHHTSSKFIGIDITDNGPGFAPELINEIFKPYFTTKQNGIGIGLAICKTIIQAHGGKLTAELPEEGGACFRIILPIKD